MATRNIQKEISNAVREYLKETGAFSEYDERVASLANMDLWLGPLTLDDGTEDADFAKLHADGLVDSEGRLNFSNACDYLRGLDIPGQLYYDEDAGMVMQSEPEGEEIEGEDGEPEYIEPAPYYSVDASEIARAIFGRELAPYIY